MVLYAVTGLYDRDTLVNLGMLTPGVLVGFGVAGLLVGRLNERVFRYVVIALGGAGRGDAAGAGVAGVELPERFTQLDTESDAS